MASAEDLTQLAGLLKPVFAKEIPSLLPEAAMCQERFKFSEEGRVGDQYWQPVLLQAPQGLTPVGATPGVVAMNTAIASVTKFAKISSYENVLRDTIAYGALDRAREEGRSAFANSVKFVGGNLAMQLRNYNELSILWGQTGIATVKSLSSQVISIDDNSFSPATLGILENAIVDVYQSDLSTVRQAGLVITAVDLDAKTVTVTGTTTGIVAGDVLFPKGACASGGAFNEQVGLWSQISNTTSTSFFGISKPGFSAWRGNNFTTVGPMTSGKLLTAAARIQARGFATGRLLALMSPKAESVLNVNAMSQRVFDQSYSPSNSRNGSDKLEFRQNGLVVETLAHPFMQEGRCMLIPEQYVMRSGAKDISMKIPGSPLEFFLPLQDSTGVQLLASSDVFIFASRPAWCATLDGITYAS